MWFLISALALAQDPAQQQLRFERTSMSVLGGWAVANLGVGTTGAFVADAPRMQGFWQANAAWNTVNLAIAGAGLLGAGAVEWDRLSDDDLQRRQRGLRTAFLVNAGLDVGYMAGGLALRQWSLGQGRPVLQGWGEAVVLQGAFLFGFDLIAAALQGTRPPLSGRKSAARLVSSGHEGPHPARGGVWRLRSRPRGL